MFIEDYLYYRMGPKYRERITEYTKPPSNKYQVNLNEPIDIGSTYKDEAAPLGLKIMYDYGPTDSLTGWDRLYSLVQYAVDHVEEIKRTQKRIATSYPVTVYFDDTTNYKTEVSLLTIDTGLIRKIPLIEFGFDHNKLENGNNVRLYIIVGMLGLAVSMSVIIIRRRMQTNLPIMTNKTI